MLNVFLADCSYNIINNFIRITYNYMINWLVVEVINIHCYIITDA